jgi:alkylation response protein AidB-like acyl-CoA dehydrogenase
MDVNEAVRRAQEIAEKVAAPAAAGHDREATFPRESLDALGRAGLLGLLVPTELGGAGLGPRAVAGVVSALAEADASVAMVYLMHVCGTACILASPQQSAVASTVRAIAKGEHLTTLAFSEKGSRSHFWAPVSRAVKSGAAIRITAQKSFATSAGQADSYVVTTLSATGKGPTDSTLYLVPAKTPGVSVPAKWDGMGLRANASASMTFEGVEVPDSARLTDEGAGFKAKLEVVLPLFNLGSAAVALGLCRAATKATTTHLKTAQFEHLGQSLGESLPTLRAQLAQMQITTDALASLVDDTVVHLEKPGDTTMLRVLESKAAGGEAAIAVTSLAMRSCGGAAFARQTGIERFFRDAHAGAVMAPTGDVLREFIGKALLGIPLF